MTITHDWKTDLILTDITAQAMFNVVEAAAYDNMDVTRLNGRSPHDPYARFSNLMRYERPASFAQAEKEGGLKRLIHKFHSLAGYCSYVPDAADLAAHQHGLQAYAFFTRNHTETSYHHQAALVPIERNGERGVFLIDPTFRQFDVFVEPRDEEPRNTPANRLQYLAPEMYFTLMARGFVQLRRENAEAYLQCFQKFDPDFTPMPDAYDQMIEAGALHVAVGG